jgi:hypothetical protein
MMVKMKLFIDGTNIIKKIQYYNKICVVKKMLAKFDLQHFCCGPKGCELEIVYGEMVDAED